MAKAFHGLLAESLRKAKQVATRHILQSSALPRKDRERLLRAGCLQRIIRGWYLLCQPHAHPGESTLWYANYWDFVAQYLHARFNDQYCLSAQASMDLYVGKNYLPPQTVVIVPHGGSCVLSLPHDTSLLLYQEQKCYPKTIVKRQHLNLLPFEYALCKLPDSFYYLQPREAEIALRLLDAPEKILTFLLKEGMLKAAGRLMGALRHIHNHDLADAISSAMHAAGFSVVEVNPFKKPALLGHMVNVRSPYCVRIQALWAAMRETIISVLPRPKSSMPSRSQLLADIDSRYVQDAYHSLSIEGYQVTEALIEKIASGHWRPNRDADDREQKNAMAAKGYFEAFKAVKKTTQTLLKADEPAKVLQKDFSRWYLALFSPSVTSGLIKAEQLAGFRNHPVYIRHAMHVPPPAAAVRDCMETLFACIASEEHPGVSAILAHWFIGFIHPYMDGNGRMARFTMNALLVSHGYPWTVVHAENRQRYMDALEKASIEANIEPFCELIKEEMSKK